MKNFVAVNYIRCEAHYQARFEQLFGTRAQAIDKMPGFINMEVLKPTQEGEYLIVSHWESEEAFKSWTSSPAFLEGHKRGFEDLRLARERGEKAPMESSFKTYRVLAN